MAARDETADDGSDSGESQAGEVSRLSVGHGAVVLGELHDTVHSLVQELVHFMLVVTMQWPELDGFR